MQISLVDHFKICGGSKCFFFSVCGVGVVVRGFGTQEVLDFSLVSSQYWVFTLLIVITNRCLRLMEGKIHPHKKITSTYWSFQNVFVLDFTHFQGSYSK